MSKLVPGRLYPMSGKVYAICVECRQLIRVDKPIIGSLHLCV